MKTEYAVAIATFVGIGIGGVAVQALHGQAKPRAYVVFTLVEFENMEKARATFASPSYNDVTIGNKYAKFRVVAAEGPSQ